MMGKTGHFKENARILDLDMDFALPSRRMEMNADFLACYPVHLRLLRVPCLVSDYSLNPLLCSLYPSSLFSSFES